MVSGIFFAMHLCRPSITRVKRALCYLILIFWLGSSALAQARDTWAAPWDAYFLPLGLPPANHCGIDASFRIANYLSFNKGAWGSINTDVEVWTVQLGVVVPSRVGEFSLSVPFSLVWGGILDVPLNAFHRFLGVPTSPEPPLSEIRYSPAMGEARVISGTRYGIGDARLAWAYSLEPFWLRLSLGVPLGDASQLLGAGGWRVLLSAGFEQPLYGVRIGMLVPLGRVAILEQFKPLVSLQVRLWWQLPLALPVLLELHLTTSPVQLGGQFAATQVALRFVWQTSAGSLTFAEDITPTLPDVVLAWEQRFSCPHMKSH